MNLKTGTKKSTATNQKARSKAKLAIKRARPIHKKMILHPIGVFMLLCTGVFIVNWTVRSYADSYQIIAKVAAAPLTQAATITSPIDNAVTTSSPINVFGTCPANSYVVLKRNATMSGVAICTVANTYQIQTSLFTGANVLNVQAYNVTDDPGPVAPDITVQYNPPVAITQAPTSPPSPSVTASPAPTLPRTVVQPNNMPFITSDFVYKSFAINALFEWQFQLGGGTAPYVVIADWGDGSTTEYRFDKPDTGVLKHRFGAAGIYKIQVKITDKNGDESWLQLVAIVQKSTLLNNSSVGSGTMNGRDSGSNFFKEHLLQIAWGSFITVGLMAVSFWLGERQELSDLLSHKMVGRRRAH